MSRRRAVIAALLALLYPGLGHLYLRKWLRAVGWFGIAVVTAALVIPASTLSAVENGGLAALIEASRNLPFNVFLTLLGVRLLNAIDAVAVVSYEVSSTRPTDGPTCPKCGRELDDDIDFCHWCTTRIDADETVEESG